MTRAEHTRDRSAHGDLYSGRGAELYDLATRYDSSEVRELLTLIRGSNATVLELAAGSGRLTLPLSRVARRVIAVDRSAELVALLRDRLLTAGTRNVTALEQDLFSIDIEETCDVVVIGTTTIALFDEEERQAIYRLAHERLTDVGLLILSLYEGIAGAPPLHLSDEITVEEQHDEKTRLRRSTIIERDGEGKVIGIYSGETHCIRIEELAEEVGLSGFTVRPLVVVSPTLTNPNHRHHLLVAVRVAK